jgi:hypothetical protein
MSKTRNEILPGAFVWDSFYDKRVQLVLEPQRRVPALHARISKAARLEFLAWPIIAYSAVDGLVLDYPSRVRRQVAFLEAYAEDPRFVASLLQELTKYHLMSEGAKSLTRKIAEASNRSSGEAIQVLFNADGNGSDQDGSLRLHDWKTIAELIGCKNSPGQLKTEFHREKRRRQDIRAKWEENFQAWHELEAMENGKRSLLPLREIRMRDWRFWERVGF